MSFVSKESEFIQFMQTNGPLGDDSKRNYISWLRYIAENLERIDNSLNTEKIAIIFDWLKSTNNTRDKYTSDSAISDIKSALNKYLAFVNSESSFSKTTNDLESILGDNLQTSKKQEIEARLGQGKYRKELIKIWNMCSITKYQKIDFLIASHIKPWRVSKDSEKIDPYNGLLLLPNLDKLFDKGYISFSSEGSIIISRLIDKGDLKILGVSESMKLFKIHKKNQPYLKYHRDSILLK